MHPLNLHPKVAAGAVAAVVYAIIVALAQVFNVTPNADVVSAVGPVAVLLAAYLKRGPLTLGDVGLSVAGVPTAVTLTSSSPVSVVNAPPVTSHPVTIIAPNPPAPPAPPA
jgi:hypothetical protein